jgi:predicted XRE-type DNA-binding protein
MKEIFLQSFAALTIHPSRDKIPRAAISLIAVFECLTQAEAGALLGIKQPYVYALMRNRSVNFSVDRLMDFSITLGQGVKITVRPTGKEHGQVSIVLT